MTSRVHLLTNQGYHFSILKLITAVYKVNRQDKKRQGTIFQSFMDDYIRWETALQSVKCAYVCLIRSFVRSVEADCRIFCRVSQIPWPSVASSQHWCPPCHTWPSAPHHSHCAFAAADHHSGIGLVGPTLVCPSLRLHLLPRTLERTNKRTNEPFIISLAASY